MEASLRAYRNTVLVLWLLALIAGSVYASTLSIPARVAAPVLAAILIEIAFYAAPGFEAVRQRLLRLSPAVLAGAMTASAVAPYLASTAPLALFAWKPFAVLLAMAAIVSFWYVLLPRRPAFDLAFIALMAAPILAKSFAQIYPSPFPKLRLDIVLGQLMWIRLGITAILLIARVELRGGFRFVPTRKDWIVGLLHFAWFVPVAFVLAATLRFAHFEVPQAAWYVVPFAAVATFLGMLWVVALAEEFFFRGLLQEWLTRWTARQWAGLLITAVLFGAVHLPFRGFPNWRMAVLATVAGLFYGRAYTQAQSIRAPMIAHALVNTLWKIFFR